MLPADSAGLVIPEGKTMIGNYNHYYNRYFDVVQFIKFCSATGNLSSGARLLATHLCYDHAQSLLDGG